MVAKTSYSELAELGLIDILPNQIKDPLNFGKNHRCCVDCGKTKRRQRFPIFTIKKKKTRSKTCVDCLRKQANDNYKDKKEANKAAALTAVIADMQAKKYNVPHLAEVAESMMRRFISVDEFTKDWKHQIDMACVNKPGSPGVLKAFKDVSTLIQAANQMTNTTISLGQLTNDDLDREMQDLVKSVVLRNPAVLEEMAKEMGMGLVKTNDCLVHSANAELIFQESNVL